MYAVVKTGGKQYKVAPGEKFKVETLEGEQGATLELSNVLLVEKDGVVKVGSPVIEGAKVTAEIVRQGRAKKILVFKHKRRKSYRKMNGHRQNFTELLVKEISA
ncbi:MAG TPA: 50S ribosomal protein L21 [Nitrospirota bacterium]